MIQIGVSNLMLVLLGDDELFGVGSDFLGFGVN